MRPSAGNGGIPDGGGRGGGRPPHLQLVTRAPEEDIGLLLDRARRGEGAATARLYERFSPDINRVVWKLLGGDPDHDDLVHDIFIRVVSQLGAVREPDKLASWVVAVAVNTVYKEMRRRQVRRLFLRAAVREAEPTGPGVDVEARDLLRRLYGLIEELGPKERLAFGLRYLDGRSLPEVATLSGWSLATVKRRLDRAKEQLGGRLARDPELARRLGLLETGPAPEGEAG